MRRPRRDGDAQPARPRAGERPSIQNAVIVAKVRPLCARLESTRRSSFSGAGRRALDQLSEAALVAAQVVDREAVDENRGRAIDARSDRASTLRLERGAHRGEALLKIGGVE